MPGPVCSGWERHKMPVRLEWSGLAGFWGAPCLTQLLLILLFPDPASYMQIALFRAGRSDAPRGPLSFIFYCIGSGAGGDQPEGINPTGLASPSGETVARLSISSRTRSLSISSHPLPLSSPPAITFFFNSAIFNRLPSAY